MNKKLQLADITSTILMLFGAVFMFLNLFAGKDTWGYGMTLGSIGIILQLGVLWRRKHESDMQ